MRYEGFLTGAQHCAGYFTTMDDDFVFLWHRRNGNPDCIAIFLLANNTIKQIREAAPLSTPPHQEGDKDKDIDKTVTVTGSLHM